LRKNRTGTQSQNALSDIGFGVLNPVEKQDKEQLKCMLSIENRVQIRENFQIEMSFENGPKKRIQKVNTIDIQKPDFAGSVV